MQKTVTDKLLKISHQTSLRRSCSIIIRISFLASKNATKNLTVNIWILILNTNICSISMLRAEPDKNGGRPGHENNLQSRSRQWPGLPPHLI